MTVSSATARAGYAGDGATTAFAVPFYFLQEADLKVVHRDAAGVETTWTLNSQYTISGTGNPAGGTLTVATSPVDHTPQTGQTLTILRSVPLTQETDYVENDPFPAETHERALDKLTMAVQQQGEVLERAFKVSEASDTDPTLPTPSEGAFLGWQSGQLANFSPTLSAETLTFGSGLQKVGTEVSVELATTNPALEFSSGQLRVKVDDTTVERTANGLALKASGLPAAADSVAGILETANQAEMEAAAATDKAVTPGRTKNHPGVAKAWVNYNGVTNTILASYNVASVTRNGTGDYTVSWDVNFATTAYAVDITVGTASGVARAYAPNIRGQSVGSVTFSTGRAQGTSNSTFQATDYALINLVAFGDQA